MQVVSHRQLPDAVPGACQGQPSHQVKCLREVASPQWRMVHAEETRVVEALPVCHSMLAPGRRDAVLEQGLSHVPVARPWHRPKSHDASASVLKC